jgi:hypothetical protein
VVASTFPPIAPEPRATEEAPPEVDEGLGVGPKDPLVVVPGRRLGPFEVGRRWTRLVPEVSPGPNLFYPSFLVFFDDKRSITRVAVGVSFEEVLVAGTTIAGRNNPHLFNDLVTHLPRCAIPIAQRKFESEFRVAICQGACVAEMVVGGHGGRVPPGWAVFLETYPDDVRRDTCWNEMP